MLTRHTYQPDDSGRCQFAWTDSSNQPHICNSSQQASILHDDPAADFREKHWHGGGDCMCFENPNGPSYQEAMDDYVNGRMGR